MLKKDSNLENIINLYSNYIFKIINNIAQNKISYQDKEEIAADVFYLYWKSKKRIKSNLKAYLASIAINATYSKMREKKIEIPLLETIKIKETNYEDLITLKEELKKLTKEELEIFTYYYYNGLKIKELATIFKKSPSTIKVTLYRIRAKLKEELK